MSRPAASQASQRSESLACLNGDPVAAASGSSGTPMDGKMANEFQRLCRSIYEDNGLDYTVMNVCGGRFQRSLHLIIFNREDDDERRRADKCYRTMSEAIAKRGVFVGRAPLDYHDVHMAQAMPAFRNACSRIKRALDPNGVIAPGKYGIH